MNPSFFPNFILCIKRSQGLPIIHLSPTCVRIYYSDLYLYERVLSCLNTGLQTLEDKLCLVSRPNPRVDPFVIGCSLRVYLRGPIQSLSGSFTRLPQSRQISEW
jgi:hypothetical protein